MGVTFEEAQRLAKRLEDELDRRQANIRKWDQYYAGEQNLAFASDRFKKAFGGLFTDFADNWCAPVVDACAERLEIRGFRFGQGDSSTPPQEDDKDARDIWQRNNMDAESKVCFTETLAKSRCFMLVWADDPDAEDVEPRITLEDASQAIVAYRPESRRDRIAAFKRWDGEDGYEYATLYLPDELWRFRRRGTFSQVTAGSSTTTGGLILPRGLTLSLGQWDVRSDDVDEVVLDNPLGKVPLVEFANAQRLVRDPAPEHKQVIPLQDAVNKLVADMMVAGEAGAFPARWGTGIDVPKDPKTGEEIDDPDMWKLSIAKLLRASDPDARFGNFQAADLSNFVAGIEMVVQHIAALTRTPPHYLLAQIVNVSGDALDSAEAGLAAKSHDKTIALDDPVEEVMRLAFAVKDDPRQNSYNAETIWADVQHRSEAQRVDAAVKKQTAGVPWRQIMEDIGYSQTQIDRMQTWREADARLGQPSDGNPDASAA